MKFYAEHTQITKKTVVIEIDAQSQEAARHINNDWQISDGSRLGIRIAKLTEDASDYSASEVCPTKEGCEKRRKDD